MSSSVVLAGCSSHHDDAVANAIDSIASESTNLRLARAGDGYGNRHRDMREDVPEVDDLTAGGTEAVDALIAAFDGVPDASRDAALVVYAYALGEMRDERAIVPLAEFLSRTRSSDLWLAPQAATHAILQLTGDAELDIKTFFYTLREIDYAMPSGHAAISPTTTQPSCRRRYLARTPSGKPVWALDRQGNLVPLAIEGTEFADITRVSAKDDWQHEVAKGGGAYVADLDGGVPNRRYNSAGYAFRELNGGGGWNVDARVLFRALMAAGLIREKSTPPAHGDKVFYTTRGAIAHVAEVERIDPDGSVIVRNADNQSGVFEAKIDAPYFTSRGYEAKIYAWSPRPQVIDDFTVQGDPGYCNGQAPTLPAGASGESSSSNVPMARDMRSGGTCPSPGDLPAGFCAGQSDCPEGGPACACVPGTAFCCPAGFCYMAEIAGCEQEICPAGTSGRNYYDDTCKCDPPKFPAYDTCSPAIMTSCAER
jgi:hypothetical protein